MAVQQVQSFLVKVLQHKEHHQGSRLPQDIALRRRGLPDGISEISEKMSIQMKRMLLILGEFHQLNPLIILISFSDVEMYDDKRDSTNDISMYGLPSEMPPWFQVFFAQYVRQREEFKGMLKAYAPRSMTPAPPPNVSYVDEEEAVLSREPIIDEATFRKMSLNITLLEGGILFHSIFVGMTVSITTDGFIVLLIAILFHQFFEGLGLGSRIAAVPYPKGAARPWILVVAFGTTAPIGQAIGLIARNSYDPQSAFALIIVGVFNAM